MSLPWPVLTTEEWREELARVARERGRTLEFNPDQPRDDQGRWTSGDVVHHGSTKDFDAFDTAKIGSTTDEGWLGRGIYFSTDKRVSHYYPLAYETQVKLENPLKISLRSFKEDKRDTVREALGLPKGASVDAVTQALKDKGHDGVVLDMSATGYNATEVMVLDTKSTRIVKKYETGNTKMWDTTAFGRPEKYRRSLSEVVERVRTLKVLKGNENSGNYGHAGRPGQVGGSATAGFTPATPAERKALGLPPAWTNVLINPDTTAALQAVGTDVKGRQQYRYSAEHSEEAAAEKFERMAAFEKELPSLRREIARDMQSGDPTISEPAAVLNLIDKTGFRIGSDTETLAEKQAYGASTLEARHVKVDGEKVVFHFVGKKGVDIHKTVYDSDLAAQMKARLEGKSRKDRLFDTTDNQTRVYMKERAKDFSAKDFRTRHATALALSLVAKGGVPRTEKAFRKARREVGEKVARYLGNTHTVALKSYINPAVFGKWQAKRAA